MTSTSTERGTNAEPARTAVVPLRRNWRFQTLWVGSAAALTGVFATDLAYPLAILALTGSPALAGLFGFVQAATSVALTLPAGQAVDRYDRRRVLIAAESVRLAATASAALAFALHGITLAHLLVVGALIGGAQPFVGSARMLTVRAVVPPEQLTAALTQDEVRGGVAELAGPPLGGLLYGLGRMLPFLFGTFGFLLSLVSAVLVRPAPAGAGAAGAARRKADGGMLAGVRTLWSDRTLRAVVVLLFTFNLAAVPLTLGAVYRLHQQSATSWSIGLALAGAAVGGLVGTTLVGPLHRRFGPGVLLLIVAAWLVPLIGLVGVVPGPWAMGAMLFATNLGTPAIMVLLDILIFRQVPDEMRGRTIASVMALLGLGVPLGSGLGGLLLQYLGGAGAMLALATVLACGTAWAAGQRGLRNAQWPAAN